MSKKKAAPPQEEKQVENGPVQAPVEAREAEQPAAETDTAQAEPSEEGSSEDSWSADADMTDEIFSISFADECTQVIFSRICEKLTGEASDPMNWTAEGGTVSTLGVTKLGLYVLARPLDMPGETLFRKAAELGVHPHPAASWPEQPLAVQLAYTHFARLVRMNMDALRVAEAALEKETAPVQPARKNREPDPRTEQLEGRLDKDADLAPRKAKPEAK